MCYQLYLFCYMQHEGPWQQQGYFNIILSLSQPVIVGVPDLLPPRPPRKTKNKANTKLARPQWHRTRTQTHNPYQQFSSLQPFSLRSRSYSVWVLWPASSSHTNIVSTPRCGCGVLWLVVARLISLFRVVGCGLRWSFPTTQTSSLPRSCSTDPSPRAAGIIATSLLHK